MWSRNQHGDRGTGCGSDATPSAATVELERHLECERIIAACVPAFVRGENNLSDEGEMASAFGWSMLASLLYGLKNPQTKEARDAIELAYRNLELPSNCQGVSECLHTFGRVPTDSTLPGLIAEEMKRFVVPEDTMDYDGIGDRLPFFRGCSIDQIRENLLPLTTSHPVESIRRWIQDWIYSTFPETIPFNEFTEELLELCRAHEMTPNMMSQAEKIVRLLARSGMPQDELLAVYEKVLNLTLPHEYYTWIAVAQCVVETLIQGKESSEAISNIVKEQAQSGIAQGRVNYATVTYFEYIKKYCPSELEHTVVNFIEAERHHWHSSKDAFKCYSSFTLLSGVTEESSHALLRELLARGVLLSGFGKEPALANCIAKSESLMKKGEAVAEFLMQAEEIIRKSFNSDRVVDASQLRKIALRPWYYSKVSQVALTLSKGGFAGDGVLSLLRDALSDCYELEANVTTIIAARLIGGHQAPEAETVLLQAFLDTGDPDLKVILADSLAMRRRCSTPKLMELLSDSEPGQVALILRAFNGTTQGDEISAIVAACQKYLVEGSGGTKTGEEVIIAALDALVDAPGGAVDELYYSALTSPNSRVKAHANYLCFSTKPNRKWFMKYRSEEHLIPLAMRLHQEGIGNAGEKIARLQLLGRHAEDSSVYSFLCEELQKEHFDEEITVALYSAVTSIPAPNVLKEFLAFLRIRELVSGNTPSINYSVAPIKMRDFNPGDSTHLECAMKLLAERKRRIVG